MAEQRDMVDYALRRRSILADLKAGRSSLAEACDAHPHLLLAARHYGAAVPTPCPVCLRQEQRHVSYVFGDSLGKTSGQAKSEPELMMLASMHDEFDVYVVEVCPDCGWNSLIRSYVLGGSDFSDRTAVDG